ncbi:MAG TPA: glycosyltransferase, partial [Caldilineaceae bacterium]|nr:glycosyltransferase [Caldilineaceae bacterium]
VTRQTLELPAAAVVAIYVGRMSGEKNLEQLITFYRQISDEERRSHLLLVGGGPDIESYRALVQGLGLAERVTITGPVEYTQLPDSPALSDFFVTASVSEVHPLTLIEAAAAGLPTLGIRSPGVGDVVVDGVTGLLAAENLLSFGLRFLRLVQDDDYRRSLGEAARATSTEYSAERCARRVLHLYRELVR